MTKNTVNKKIVRNKRGALVAETDFRLGKCFLHPIPKSLQAKSKKLERQVVTGYYTNCKEAPVKDKCGKTMYIEPFIPIQEEIL